ncbi:hypothetical protein [Leptotrichia hofstadii]|uniref:Lipoprotein n=1 Tax=Leptotrichia hofstadii F0254 TaxID=634994 RepID=C9MY36_9FUSO|nr:hypothetical protein [Leptotrichia hofstadii]EEX74416.1 hypothetical protein GCWU000323_01458 [Leptotrichia hofstadii F0254]
MFKKILLMIILVMSVVGCSARDIALWKEAEQERREEGRKCYKRSNGDYYCKDRYGNIVY